MDQVSLSVYVSTVCTCERQVYKVTFLHGPKSNDVLAPGPCMHRACVVYIHPVYTSLTVQVLIQLEAILPPLGAI